jgi:hypothetical protein
MPLPDVLPPELWHYIISIASIDPSRLVPWLSVAPYTCAKGMHDAAFAELLYPEHRGSQGKWMAQVSTPLTGVSIADISVGEQSGLATLAIRPRGSIVQDRAKRVGLMVRRVTLGAQRGRHVL